ncbi:hypothetical protein ACIBSS_30745 [Micromonospora aurantiaca]|uniref:hypothetical protein n=1 Tax=Micromonospora aurantiaca (nom. illeg.) TaxID=47850 RepID=UPI0011CDFF0B|nr:hypothetical protein [Micromonospora aurantiaca]
MRHDFRVMNVSADGKILYQEIAEELSQGSYTGIHIRIPKGSRLRNLEGINALRGLRYLEVTGRVDDDTAAFGVDALEELVLATRCRVAIPAIAAPKLQRLGVDDRPGKENIAPLPRLRSLFVWLFKGGDLCFLEGLRNLVELRLEGGPGDVSLRGIEGCSSLEEVEIVGMRVASLQPLASLSQLRRCWLIGSPKFKSEEILDLEDLSNLTQLEELRLTFAGSVRTVDPVRAMASLREIRLRGTRIADGDPSPLIDFANHGTVVFPGG